jgi:hypothetical protein
MITRRQKKETKMLADQEKKVSMQDYWKGFPEAPATDTIKWVDMNGFDHFTTIRAWTPSSLKKAVDEFISRVVAEGGKSISQLAPAPSAEPVMVQMRDENNTPIVGVDQKPIMEKIDGAKVYTIEGVAHDKTSGGKDVLKVFTVEQESFISRKYGVTCFHAPVEYKDFKNWPVGSKYGPKEGAMHVIIKAPEGDSKYANIVDFRP